MELNWDVSVGMACPALQATGLLERAGYHFANPARQLIFQQSGDWLQALSDVVARPVCTE